MPVSVQWAKWKDWGETGAKGWAEALPPKESKTRNYSTLIIISSVRIWVLAVKINRKNWKSQSKMHSWMKQHEIHHILKYSLLVNKGFVLLVYDTISKVSICWYTVLFLESFRSEKVDLFFCFVQFLPPEFSVGHRMMYDWRVLENFLTLFWNNDKCF